MIDIKSRYQMMPYLVMDIPYERSNEVMLKILKENSKTNDFISAYRTLITHFYEDLFKEVDQEHQVTELIPMMNEFSEFINNEYEDYLAQIKMVLKDYSEDDGFITNVSELIGIRTLLITAAGYFKSVTGKKSSKLKRLLFLMNMIIVIYDKTKMDINLDTFDNVVNSLESLLAKTELYRDNK